MVIKKFAKIFFICLILIVLFYIIYYRFYEDTEVKIVKNENQDISYNSNILKDIEYNTKDKDENEYIIKALQGEIDFSNPNILFLTNVKAIIKLNTSEIITITSDYGRYNSENNDTIFSKNVKINYLENAILSQYLDFSLIKNYMIISKNVVYTNLENVLKADVVEIDLKTKDSKIFMYEKNKKVNIKSKN